MTHDTHNNLHFLVLDQFLDGITLLDQVRHLFFDAGPGFISDLAMVTEPPDKIFRMAFMPRPDGGLEGAVATGESGVFHMRRPPGVAWSNGSPIPITSDGFDSLAVGRDRVGEPHALIVTDRKTIRVWAMTGVPP